MKQAIRPKNQRERDKSIYELSRKNRWYAYERYKKHPTPETMESRAKGVAKDFEL